MFLLTLFLDVSTTASQVDVQLLISLTVFILALLLIGAFYRPPEASDTKPSPQTPVRPPPSSIQILPLEKHVEPHSPASPPPPPSKPAATPSVTPPAAKLNPPQTQNKNPNQNQNQNPNKHQNKKKNKKKKK